MASESLIILGQGPSMIGCPFDTETWASVSVLSHQEWEDAPVSKVFLFDKLELKEDERLGVEVAQRRGLPIVGESYMADYPPVGTNVVTEEYPLREIQKEFNTLYFKNDTSYMIAYAIHLGYKHLSLWGVDQGGVPEGQQDIYSFARAYVMFWLGVATGRGITWELAPNSILLRDD